MGAAATGTVATATGPWSEAAAAGPWSEAAAAGPWSEVAGGRPSGGRRGRGGDTGSGSAAGWSAGGAAVSITADLGSGGPPSSSGRAGSHTHTGPVLTDALMDMYPVNEQQLEDIRKYSDQLVEKIINLTGQALKSLKPAQLYSQNGITRFQVNRRNNTEKTLNSLTELKGPNDYSVPVFKITDQKGKLKTVVFGYACHATVLATYQFSGDYPGFAQLEVEKLHPGVTAMFFQGAGADQNPLPRRSVALAQQYGRELAAAVERVLSEDMKKLEASISTAYDEIDLTFAAPPSKDELTKIANEQKGLDQKWALNQLDQLNKNGHLRISYPYPLESWKLGDQTLMALGGELVVQYALELKKFYGPDIFVMGYANDDMAYIPSEIILKEGGYEGESSQRVYGLPAKWNSNIQTSILAGMQNVAEKAGVNKLIVKQ
jgi:hypothetical protein